MATENWQAVLESFRASGRRGTSPSKRTDVQLMFSIRLRVHLEGALFRVMTTEHQDRWRELVSAIGGACPHVTKLCDVLDEHEQRTGLGVVWQRATPPPVLWGPKVKTAIVRELYRSELETALVKWRERSVWKKYLKAA